MSVGELRRRQWNAICGHEDRPLVDHDPRWVSSRPVPFRAVYLVHGRCCELTCNGRKTDSMVAALGCSGAGATVPPRPLSTLPENVSWDAEKERKIKKTMSILSSDNALSNGPIAASDDCETSDDAERNRTTSPCTTTNPVTCEAASCTAWKTGRVCPVSVAPGTQGSARSSRSCCLGKERER